MVILLSGGFSPVATNDPVSPLHVLWYGSLDQPLTLPHLGHLFLVCPVDHALISCSNTIVDGEHYLLLTLTDYHQPLVIKNLHGSAQQSKLLLLMMSPDFIAEMADFIGIPSELSNLLDGIPLVQGDALSDLLQQLINALDKSFEADELYLEVVGQILRFMRLRHDTLLRLANHKRSTVSDLLPRLLQARQFIEARYLESIKTKDVADYVALSEYHFARLFKVAFDVTVHQYVMRLRLIEARHLLEGAESNITDIAYRVGYNSLSAFIRAFRQHIDMTPSDYQALFKDVEN